jgi:hypothetical protein
MHLDQVIEAGYTTIKEKHLYLKDLKYELKQADDQIVYFEELNRKNTAAQSQMQRALD